MRLLRRLFVLMVLLNVVFVAVLALLKRNIPSLGDEDSDEVALASIMDGRTLRSRAGAFRGGSSLTVAGAQVLDLRAATLAPGGGSLALRSVMGAIALVVPRSWAVQLECKNIAGACEDKRGPAPIGAEITTPPGDVLRVDAMAVMGSITVSYEPEFEIDQPTFTGEREMAPTVV
jgi:hypothetical protein